MNILEIIEKAEKLGFTVILDDENNFVIIFSNFKFYIKDEFIYLVDNTSRVAPLTFKNFNDNLIGLNCGISDEYDVHLTPGHLYFFVADRSFECISYKMLKENFEKYKNKSFIVEVHDIINQLINIKIYENNKNIEKELNRPF